jgi:DNA mismatch repair protein MutL
MLEFSDGGSPWRVHGYLSPPDLSYRDRNHLYLFVNGRPVRDRLILSALASGWEGFFPRGAYPAVVLFLELPTEEVDVNVHPTKAEVRFKDSQRIFPWISRATRGAWEKAKAELPSVLSLPPKPSAHDFDSHERRPIAAQEHRRLWDSGGVSREAYKSIHQAFSGLDRPYSYALDASKVAESAAVDTGDPYTSCPLRYLGSFHGTYLLAEYRDGDAAELWIVDQHAAHERVLYEQLFLRRHQPASQPLLPPKAIALGRAEMARINPFLEELCSVGVDVEAFGDDAVTVRALPDFLIDRSPESLIEDILAKLESSAAPDLGHFRKDLNAALACRSAIKKNHALDAVQAQALLEALISCETPLTCPHGRPVIKRMTLAELERSFGRRG